MGKKIRTRFPMARIKKIMQSDEDVGKVAQATPVLISKTLELFLQKLVERAVLRTQAKGARVVSVAHLKQCIMEEPQFDFLKDAVQKVPDVVPEESGQGGGKEKRSKSKKLSSSTASLVSSQEDDEDDEEEEEDEDEEEEEEEEEKPKRPAKKARKAPAQAKRVSISGAPMESVIHVNPQPAVAAAAAAPAAKVKEEAPASADDRPVVVSAGLVAAPLTTKLQAMDDDYDMAQ